MSAPREVYLLLFPDGLHVHAESKRQVREHLAFWRKTAKPSGRPVAVVGPYVRKKGHRIKKVPWLALPSEGDS